MSDSQNTVVRVRPQTRDKLDAICAAFRWGIGDSIDAICDDFIGRWNVPYEGDVAPVFPTKGAESNGAPSIRGNTDTPGSTKSRSSVSKTARKGRQTSRKQRGSAA